MEAPQKPINVERRKEKFTAQPTRVIAKFYLPGGENRTRHIIDRIRSLSEDEVHANLEEVITDFAARHKDVRQIFTRNFDEVARYIPADIKISDDRRTLIGAYFTHEYSIQAAAFFNPSIVDHPDQQGVAKGERRVILSFRSTGEGHISSIEFRSGVLDKKNDLCFDVVSRYVETPEVIKNPTYDNHTFRYKLEDMETLNEVSEHILGRLPDHFSFYDLNSSIQNELDSHPEHYPLLHETIDKILWLARSNYELKFRKDRRISTKVIFPVSENESRGIEDARFVRFIDETGEMKYYATYTAYNGFNILPMLLETKDFVTFRIKTLNGVAAQNKGMALFPRKIKGKYMMISRQDGENMFIMSSDNIHFWHEATLLSEPTYPWEFIQIGNCGSPLETEAGWILLTHGVGAMRKYCIGACLLDLDDPSKVIGHLPEPLLRPTEDEREGYVPNVLYTCGAMIHNGELVIPYSMSDTASGLAVLPVKDLLSRFIKA
ncbi:MAG: glycoside hydrolase family 130 protein [Proteobacteria bacterium]|nr:glycoside hydrolase family 130 protein [Pseudomonadota bacterium]